MILLASYRIDVYAASALCDEALDALSNVVDDTFYSQSLSALTNLNGVSDVEVYEA